MHRVEKEVCGRTLSIEYGRVARQADAGVLARYGETVVLASACYRKQPAEYLPFFPLTIDYRELAYAAGKIPGGFFKREGRPRDKETLTCRLIDRPIRPLFPDRFRNETQIVAYLMSTDFENESEMLALITHVRDRRRYYVVSRAHDRCPAAHARERSNASRHFDVHDAHAER